MTTLLPEPASLRPSSRIRDSLVPVHGTIVASEDVETASRILTSEGVDHLAIIDPVDGPVGIITRDDIAHLQRKYPDYWSAMRCGNVVTAPADFLTPDEPVEAAAEMFLAEELRPLLIKESGAVAGVLEPTVVLQWCAEHRPAMVEQLVPQAGTISRSNESA